MTTKDLLRESFTASAQRVYREKKIKWLKLNMSKL